MKIIDAAITIFAEMENFLSEYSQIIEIMGTIAGILGVWLTIRQNIWCFPVGIVNVLLYSWLTFDREIFANALLQLVYMAILIYGWYNWTKGKTVEMDLPVSQSSRNLLLTLAVIFVLVFAGVYFVLVKYTPSDVPVADSFTFVPVADSFIFSLAIIAQYMIARKKIENWHLWIIVNVVSIGLYVHKELYYMTGFHLLLIIMAVIGYREWKKDLKKIQA